MPRSTRFYFTVNDWWSLLSSIVNECDVSFAVDLPYTSNDCRYFKNIDETIKQSILTTARRIFILDSNYLHEPLFLRLQSTGKHAGKYFIDEAKGGPSLSLSMSAQFQERDIMWFSEGNLSIRDKYWSAVSQSWKSCLHPLKNSFSAIDHVIDNHTKTILLNAKTLRVSTGVLKLFELGKAGLPSSGRCYTAGGEVPAPAAWVYKAT